MTTQFDPTYLVPDPEPAQHVARGGDLLDIALVPDDWRALCTEETAPMTPAEERAFWWRVAWDVQARRDAKAVLL